MQMLIASQVKGSVKIGIATTTIPLPTDLPENEDIKVIEDYTTLCQKTKR